MGLLGELSEVPVKALWSSVWRPDAAASQRMLDVAEASLRSTVADLQLRGSILRKPRAVGLIPGGTANAMAIEMHSHPDDNLMSVVGRATLAATVRTRPAEASIHSTAVARAR